MSKSGSYIGGHTVITIRRSEKDMQRWKEHWKHKLEREQKEHDASRQRQRDQTIEVLANADHKRREVDRVKFEEWQRRKAAAQNDGG